MSGALQAVFQNQRSFGEPAPTVIGQAYGGGYYAGQISVAGNGTASHYLVIGPVASAENAGKSFKTELTATSGTSSAIDGPTNSTNMNNATHPAAQFCKGITTGGFTDWYMPAKNELDVCYYNLKPNTSVNNTNTGTGINANAVPARSSEYTNGTPARTSATNFRDTGAECFQAQNYWSSTQATAPPTGYDTDFAWKQTFDSGRPTVGDKTDSVRVRAVRRVPI